MDPTHLDFAPTITTSIEIDCKRKFSLPHYQRAKKQKLFSDNTSHLITEET